ncbi:MAG TPA: response regulator [Chryseosolibacter sp.]
MTSRTPSRILLADDDADDRELFEEALSDIYPQAVLSTAQDGEELMFILHNYHKPDLLFLDLNMPRKNGKECLYEIARDPELKKIPIVIFSTSVNPLDIEETFSLGALLFFRKPNSYEELRRNVNDIFFRKLTSPRSRETFLVSAGASVTL